MHTTTYRSVASLWRLLAARTRSSAGVLAGILAAVVVAIALICGLSAVAELQLRDAVRDAVPPPETSDGWLQLQTRPAEDAAAQDAAAAALFADVLGQTANVERLELGEPGSDLERVAWRITPDADRLGSDTIGPLSSGLDRLADAFRSSEAAVRGASASGGLPAALTEVEAGARAATALLPVPLVVLGVLAWFAVLQLARLLGLSRGREAALLRARGMSAGQSFSLAAGESLVIAGLGSAIGWAAILAIVPAIPGGSRSFDAARDTWPLALAGAVAVWATLTIGQLRETRRATGATAAAGRTTRAATPAAGILLVVLAGVMIWQARGPADGTWGLVVTTLAPALGVIAVAILSVLVFGPVSALAAALLSHGRRVVPSYPALQIARRLSASAVAIALVAIAVCGTVLAGGYAGMASTTAADSQRVQAGAALRAILPVGAGDMASARGTEGVSLAAPALVAPIGAGDGEAVLLALPAAVLPELLFDVPGAAEPADVAEAVGVTSPLVGVDTPTLTIDAVAVSQTPEAIGDSTVRAWIVDAYGVAIAIPLPVEVESTAGTPTFAFHAEAALPEGEWRLAGVEIARGVAWPYADISLVDVTVSAGATLDLDLPDVVRLYGGFGDPGVSSELVWSANGADTVRIPVAVTAAFASTLGLGVGDRIDLPFSDSGRVVTATVAAVFEAIPGIGVGPGVIADLGALTVAQMPSEPVAGEPAATPPLPDQLWAAGDESAAPALAEVLDAVVMVPESQSTAVTAPVTVVWIAAALGGAVLAGVALVALLAALTRQRAGEVLVLRAIGLAPRSQSRQRIGEAVAVVATAVVLGTAGGLVLAALLVPGLVMRAVPSAQLVPALAIEAWPIAATLAVIAAGCVVGGLVIAGAIRTQSASTRLEEAAP